MRPDLLERIDAIAALVAELRAEVAGAEGETSTIVQVSNGLDVYDLADLIDTHSAAARWGLARDTIAKMCREIDGIGVWKGGRWMVRVGALRQHLDRKNNQ